MAPPRIYHLISGSRLPFSKLFQGVMRYAHQHTNWTFPQRWFYDWRDREKQFAVLKRYRIDGCIALIDDEIMVEMLASLKIPVVDILGKVQGHPFPMCLEDYDQSGVQAAEYLLQRGYFNLRIMTPKNQESYHIKTLIKGFEDEALKSGASCLRMGSGEKLTESFDHPIPGSAVFSISHSATQRLHHHLITTGRSIPNDLAVLNYGQSTVFQDAELGISTLNRPMFATGYHAAKILDAMLKGGRAPQEPTLIPPEGIKEDRSTNELSIEDPELKQAVQFIDQHYQQPININDIAEDSSLSRRSLERRFQSRLKISPQKLLEKKRMARIRQLLINSEMPISLIASHAGYNDPVHMTNVFKRYTQLTPRQYRSQYRSH